MNKKRLKELRQYAHDEQIRIKAHVACGKLVPRLDMISIMYSILEEILEHIEKETTPNVE